MSINSSKQPQADPSSLNGRGDTGRTPPAEFVARQFKPGQSGNPSGNRGSSYGEVVRAAREYGPRAVERLAELMESNDERVALLAAQALLDRGYCHRGGTAWRGGCCTNRRPAISPVPVS